MLSMTSGLHRSMATWVSQVIASVGATLVATMIYSALPHFMAPDRQSPPAMTSGGKFAVRATDTADLTAYDGLDRMPLPQVYARSVPVAVLPASAPVAADERPEGTLLRPAVLAPTPVVAPPAERPLKPAHPSHAPLRTAARQGPPVAPVAPASTVSLPAEPATASSESDQRWQDGLVPRFLSTAQAAWSITASAGGALVARVIPQLP